MFTKLTKEQWFSETGDILHYTDIKSYISQDGKIAVLQCPYSYIVEPHGHCKIRTGIKVDVNDHIKLNATGYVHENGLKYIGYDNIAKNITVEFRNDNDKPFVLNTGDEVALAIIYA
jgi:dUTPase